MRRVSPLASDWGAFDVDSVTERGLHNHGVYRMYPIHVYREGGWVGSHEPILASLRFPRDRLEKTIDGM